MLIDAHCHLDDEQFANDLDAVLSRAADAGVNTIITAGADVDSSRAGVALSERYASIYAIVGIHPEHADAFNGESLEAIRDLAQHRRVIGIGEIGLDYYWENNPPPEMQLRAFNAQLDLAAELGKPVVIHDREAHAELMDILVRRRGNPQGVLHCFSGDLEMARRAIDLGYYISFAGNVTFKNARQLHEVVRAIPLECMIIETDSPFLSPQRGKRNEPANVALVAAKIAELKDIAIPLVDETTTSNIRSLFGLSQTE